jgi:hypothetical protein
MNHHVPSCLKKRETVGRDGWRYGHCAMATYDRHSFTNSWRTRNIRKPRGARLEERRMLREPLVAARGIAQIYDDIRDEVRATILIGSVCCRVHRVERRLSGSSAVRIVS